MFEIVWHTLGRFVLHLICDSGAGFLSFFGFHALGKHLPKLFGWLMHPQTLRIVSLLVALTVIFLREPLDVARGGLLGKSYIDWVSHAGGLSLFYWGSWRFIWVLAHLWGVEEDLRVALRREGWL